MTSSATAPSAARCLRPDELVLVRFAWVLEVAQSDAEVLRDLDSALRQRISIGDVPSPFEALFTRSRLDLG
jgi:hypothetical protein